MTEAFGFITGALCVYLTLRENVWNFPIGVANNLLFLILFLQGKLFGDAGLQIVYIVLGVIGWYQWLYGGTNRTALQVTRAPAKVLLWVVLFVAIGTPCFTAFLRSIKDASPLWDSFTTILSLAAQYLLNRKALENWFFWLLADVIYVYLYISRGLHLTAVLYFGFACLCIAGAVAWRKSLERVGDATVA